jgi:hypothetical protein
MGRCTHTPILRSQPSAELSDDKNVIKENPERDQGTSIERSSPFQEMP